MHKCLTKHIYWYERDLALELFDKLPIFINQCSFQVLRPYFEEIKTEDGRRSVLFLPRERMEMSHSEDDRIIPYSGYLASDDDECTIVHVTNDGSDINLELLMKTKYPDCQVVKVDPNANWQQQKKNVKIVPARLNLTFDENIVNNDQGNRSIDLETLTSVVLKSSYIEALYLDESVSYFDFWKYFHDDEISELLHVCQITITINKPKNRNEITMFWNFVAVFLLDLRLVLVSSRRINSNQIDVVFYNAKHEMCNFKHFSIVYDWKGIKF